jgi:tetratricopeptide (TPR) repeat protein
MARPRLPLKPRNAKQAINAGLSAFSSGRVKAAIALYSAAIVSGELSKYELASAHGLRGIAYLAIEQHRKALKDLTISIRLRPHAVFYGARCEVHQEIGEIKRAIEDCRTALRLDKRLKRPRAILEKLGKTP